jgi:hypothetical protein
MLQKAPLRQEIENIIAVDQRGYDRHRRGRGVAAIIKQPRCADVPHYRPWRAMTAKAMAAVGFKSSKVALGTMGNLGRDRLLDWFNSDRVDLGREVEQLPARDVRGQRDGPQHGQRGSRGQPQNRRAREMRR